MGSIKRSNISENTRNGIISAAAVGIGLHGVRFFLEMEYQRRLEVAVEEECISCGTRIRARLKYVPLR